MLIARDFHQYRGELKVIRDISRAKLSYKYIYIFHRQEKSLFIINAKSKYGHIMLEESTVVDKRTMQIQSHFSLNL